VGGKSLKKLIAYNKGDIKAGAEVYFKLLPYIRNHPNLNKMLDPDFRKDRPACGACGHKKVVKDGTILTKQGKYQRYKCMKCGYKTKGGKI
jgi:predicted RNA-binding Zn-ribbon protein involved in translation (DUF1610 family)